MTQIIENKGTCGAPKTLKKDLRDDDEPAALMTSDNKIDFEALEVFAEMSFETNSSVSLSDPKNGEIENILNAASKKLIGKELTSNDSKKLKELAELLVMELEIAAARTNSISNVPAFLTEHLRRRLLGKPVLQIPDKKGETRSGQSFPVGEIDNLIPVETFEAEPLTAQARQTLLRTMREYIDKGQREFVMSFQNTYTAEDWKWLSENLFDVAENDKSLSRTSPEKRKNKNAK